MIDLARFDDDDVRVTLFERRTRDEMRGDMRQARIEWRISQLVSSIAYMATLLFTFRLGWIALVLVTLAVILAYAEGRFYSEALKLGAVKRRRFPWQRKLEATP